MSNDTATGDAAGAERLFTGYGGHLLIALSLGWFTIQIGRLVLSPLLPTIIDDLAITPTQAGFGLTTLWGVYALFQYPSGHLSDRLSRKTLVVAGLVMVVLGFGLFGLATSYPLFLVAAVVAGVGTGLYPTAARALISDHFVEKRGRAFGLHTGSGDIGGGAAAGLTVLILGAAVVWRTAYLPVVAVLLLVLLLVHVRSREPYTVERVSLDVRGALGRMFGDTDMRWLLGAYCCFTFAWQASVGFLPTFLQAGKGLSPTLASAGFAGLFLVGATVKPLSGSLGDRIARGPVAAACLAFGALTLSALLLVQSTVAIGAATLLYAVGLMGFPPVMQSYLMDIFPDNSMGADLGFMRTVYIGVGALGPTYVGFVAERASYDTAFAGLVALLLVAATVVGWRVR
jgi:MFS family permease